MKTIFTGLLFRVFLGRRLSGAQYLALVTLACGTATSQIPSGATTGHASFVGLLLSVMSSMLSALGGAPSMHPSSLPRTHWGRAGARRFVQGSIRRSS